MDHEGERRTMSIVTGRVLYIFVSIQVNGRKRAGRRDLHKVSTFNDKEIGLYNGNGVVFLPVLWTC